MAVTIDTTSSAGAGRRLSAFDSTGRLWVAHYDNASTRYEFWYSDNGTTFTEATSLRVSVGVTNASLDIDTTVDRAVFAFSNGSGGAAAYRVVTGITSSSSWTTITPSFWYGTVYCGEVVTFVKPSSSNYYVVAAGISYSAPNYNMATVFNEYTSAHAFVTGGLLGLSSGEAGVGRVSVDFRHDGAGSQVAASSPDVFVSWTSPGATSVYFAKASWGGSGWTSGTTRTIGTCNSSTSHVHSGVFDGTQYVMAWSNSSNLALIDIAHRDAGDTATQTAAYASMPALSGGNIQSLGLSYDTSGNPVMHASGATNDDIHRLRFVRSSGWETWSTIETASVAGTPHIDVSSTRKWGAGKGIAVNWYETGLNWRSTTDFVNTAPSAPTWTAPGNNLAQDRGAALTLDWAFVDIDLGDTQSAYKIKRRVNGGSAEWWTGSAWGAETKITSTTTSLAMSSGWATDGDSVVYNVLCYDAADAVGPYSDDLTVIASVPDNPTMTAPATSATITVAQPTVSWTVAEQSAYQVDVYETGGSPLLYSTGKITSSTTSITLGYTLENGLTDLVFKITTWNADDLVCSTPDENSLVDVTYTVPLTPVLTVSANTAGYISVAVADPTPSATPTVLYHDVYVRVAAGGRADGERPVGGDGIRISTGTVPEDGTYLDYAAASGVSYEYRVQAFGDNGAVVYSAWT